MDTQINWRDKAACQGHVLAEEGAWDSDHTQYRDLALDVCNTCPVRKACYDYAVKDINAEGIYGGSLFLIRPYARVKSNPSYGVPEYVEPTL